MNEIEQKNFDDDFGNLPEHKQNSLMFSSLVCAASCIIVAVVCVVCIAIRFLK